MNVRIATPGDVPFMDALQKRHGKALGYFPTKQFEGYVETGGVLVAVAATPASRELDSTLRVDRDAGVAPTGYIISRDRYLKRDELGVIFQLCVEPGTQRKLVGAALVREVFARSAYGCKLYCCWCAQDLDANYFWESLGFVPVAFRAGSDKKKRVHIFWQRRISEADETTPFWYPFQTNSGAIRQDRIVFPIPPGTHWKEVEAVVLPRRGEACLAGPDRDAGVAPTKRIRNPKSKSPKNTPKPGQVAIVVGGRIKYIDRPGYVAPDVKSDAAPAPEAKKAKPKRKAEKIDPKYFAAAREFRDRYLERFNSGMQGGLPAGKYEVSRALPGPVEAPVVEAPKALPQAA